MLNGSFVEIVSVVVVALSKMARMLGAPVLGGSVMIRNEPEASLYPVEAVGSGVLLDRLVVPPSSPSRTLPAPVFWITMTVQLLEGVRTVLTVPDTVVTSLLVARAETARTSVRNNTNRVFIVKIKEE